MVSCGTVSIGEYFDKAWNRGVWSAGTFRWAEGNRFLVGGYFLLLGSGRFFVIKFLNRGWALCAYYRSALG